MTFDRREKPRRRRDLEADAARRDARREEFLAAAITVIRREGAGASMEAIAREAGVTKPILYRVFGDREGLLIALGAMIGARVIGTAGENNLETVRRKRAAVVVRGLDHLSTGCLADLDRRAEERDPVGGLRRELDELEAAR